MSFFAQRLQRVGMTHATANLLLFSITMAWGLSYALLKLLGDSIPPFEMLALRFTFSSLFCILVFRKRLKRITKQTLNYGVLLGTVMYFTSSAIVYGMQTTDASTASFLTSSAIVIVPVAQAVRKRHLPEKKIIAGTIGTAIGIALLSLEGSLSLSFGAGLCIFSAVLYATHIILTDQMTRQEDAILLGVIQQIALAGWGWITTLLFNTPVMPSSSKEWLVIAVLSLVCGAFAFIMQPFAQSYTTPENTALIFSLEPVFGACFGMLLLGEQLSFQASCGAILVLASVLLTTIHLDTATTKRIYGIPIHIFSLGHATK